MFQYNFFIFQKHIYSLNYIRKFNKQLNSHSTLLKLKILYKLMNVKK